MNTELRDSGRDLVQINDDGTHAILPVTMHFVCKLDHHPWRICLPINIYATLVKSVPVCLQAISQRRDNADAGYLRDISAFVYNFADHTFDVVVVGAGLRDPMVQVVTTVSTL